MKIRRIFAALLSIVMLMTIFGVAAAETNVYQGEAKGFGGQIRVEVTVDNGAIASVAVTEHSETQGIGTNAIDVLPAEIVQTQSLALDTVSGCTITSRALLSAVEAAAMRAGLDMDKLATAPIKEAIVAGEKELETDIVVVGAGLAGLSAAIEAKQNGMDVILLEKLGFTGGNSKLSTGVFHFGATDIQKANGIEDTPDAFYDFSMEKSGGRRDPIQTRMVAENGNNALNWLMSMGVEISDKVAMPMGSPHYRSHQSLPNAPGMLDQLTKAAVEHGVELMLLTPATELIVGDGGAVNGVIAMTESGDKLTIKAKKTILAAGGFAASPELLEKYWGYSVRYAGVPSTTGEMMEAAIALGADVADIAEPYLTPSVEYHTGTLVTALVLSKGGFLVDDEGKRFCDETSSYFEAAQAVFATEQEYVYEIFDSHVKEHVFKVEDYIGMGIVIEANTLEELAQKVGLPADALVATADTYNAGVRGDAEDPFGREIVIDECNKAPFYCILVEPGTTFPGGGLKINEKCEVVKTDGTVIPNLYAAGEITGGYRAFGYIGGDSLSQCVVTGLNAGKIAANAAK